MPAPSVQFHLTPASQARFNTSFSNLYTLSRRDLPDFANKTAYSIALKARSYTPASTAAAIETGLTRDIQTSTQMTGVIGRSGKFSTAKKLLARTFKGRRGILPLMVAILQSRSRPGHPFYRGPSPWYGVPRALGAQRMTEALRRFLGSRKSSGGFYRTGWLAAIMGLRRAYRGSDLPPMSERETRRLSRFEKLGGFTAATPTRLIAHIVNHTLSRFDPRQDALARIGRDPLQRAFNEEAAAMQREYERRLAKLCHQLGIPVR